jgi:uncharacterized protein YcaQ
MAYDFLTRHQARRFLVRRHLLAPARALPARPESVLAVVERLGSLQFDPLEAPGARNHELVLHARVRGYRRGWCERWLYGAERRLFEAWNKGLSILPVGELAEHREVWDVARERYAGFLETHAAVAARILEAIRERGALATSAFGRGEVIDWWWGRTAVNRAVIDVLFLCGRLGIARRDGNLRVYDLIERLLPERMLGKHTDGERARRHRLLTRVRALGLLAERASAEVLHGTGTAGERRARLDALVEDGTLLRVEVEGVRGACHMLASERGLVGRALRPTVSFLGALDPLLWDRRLLRDLWGFEYLWEVYTPEAKRRWGYYVLPVLWGDRLVGRIEPRVDRGAQRLDVVGLSLEPGVEVDEGFAAAFAEAARAYAGFVGAREVRWPRLRGAARALSATLRRNG